MGWPADELFPSDLERVIPYCENKTYQEKLDDRVEKFHVFEKVVREAQEEQRRRAVAGQRPVRPAVLGLVARWLQHRAGEQSPQTSLPQLRSRRSPRRRRRPRRQRVRPRLGTQRVDGEVAGPKITENPSPNSHPNSEIHLEIH